MTPLNARRPFGIGPTSELSLRVSAATLARVVFPDPESNDWMLALEHKAALHPGAGEPQVVVRAQPFGGAVRIPNPVRLESLLPGFHFESKRTRAAQDFRIFIRPSDWPGVRDFLLTEFGKRAGAELETDPARELVEEFDDSLGVKLKLNQYMVKPAGTIIENAPAATGNLNAPGTPTVRVYRIFEVQIVDASIREAIMDSSANHPAERLRRLALEDARNGGRGRANAVLVAPLHQLRTVYLGILPEQRGETLQFEGAILEGNVPAVLEGIPVPKYSRISQAQD